jgi:hypothetical protein
VLSILQRRGKSSDKQEDREFRELMRLKLNVSICAEWQENLFAWSTKNYLFSLLCFSFSYHLHNPEVCALENTSPLWGKSQCSHWRMAPKYPHPENSSRQIRKVPLGYCEFPETDWAKVYWRRCVYCILHRYHSSLETLQPIPSSWCIVITQMFSTDSGIIFIFLFPQSLVLCWYIEARNKCQVSKWWYPWVLQPFVPQV